METVKKYTVNPDLAKERESCIFQTSELTHWWNEGEDKVREKRKIESYFFEDPLLSPRTPLHYLSPKEQYEETIRRIALTVNKLEQWKSEGNGPLDLGDPHLLGSLRNAITPLGNPVGLHFSMFVPTIEGQGTEAQKAQWLDKAKNLEIIGTYAQTELGHGTFVRGLETTATYDQVSQEFVINTPSLSAYKWWPGGMGQTTTHCILIAQLFTQGKACGVFPFIVQLRDPVTYAPLKGITIGEIGPKLGLATVNQGYLAFDNLRVPRTSMMMKNAQVLEDGAFVKSAPDVLTYGTMTFVRVGLVYGTSVFLAMASTIAIRYSAVRKQSQINTNEPEIQIMDHLTQQHKLFPPLAQSIVFRLASKYIWGMYTDVMTELKNGLLDRLPEMHALTCCLKSVTTADCAVSMEALRLACGGHGYMASSNLYNLYGYGAASRTYEGENTVLLLQTARYLIKAWKASLSAKPLQPSVAYLSQETVKMPMKGIESVQGIAEAFQFSTAMLVKSAFENIKRRQSSGMTLEEATNATSIQLIKAAEMHCRAFLITSAFSYYQEQLAQKLSPELGKVIWDLIELFTLDTALSNLDVLLPYAELSEGDIANLQQRMEAVLGRIRPNAVGIVDSFDFHDQTLNSTLGSYDGNVYERLMEDALKSPLNQEPVNKAFHLYLRPMMTKSKI